VPRASRQRLGGSAGVRRRLYSLQQPGAEVLVVVVVVRRRRKVEERKKIRLDRAVRGMTAGGFCVGMQV